MSEQRTFAEIAWSMKGRTTRRERFLREMDAVIPWARLIGLIEPYYPKAGKGRRSLGLEKMRWINFLQQWFDLSGLVAEDAMYDSESMRRLVGVELGEDTIPDESTILHCQAAPSKDSIMVVRFRPASRIQGTRTLDRGRIIPSR